MLFKLTTYLPFFLAFTWYFSAIGTGKLISLALSRRQTRAWNPGIDSFLGLFGLSLLLFILNGLLKISLGVSAKLTFALSLLGLGILLFHERKQMRRLFGHPLFLMGLPALLTYLCFGNLDYHASVADEWSHWLTMPKQMALFQEMISPSFQTQEFSSYTPSWPLLMIYPTLALSKTFAVKYILLLPFVLVLFFLSALYDYLGRIFLSHVTTLHEKVWILLFVFSMPLLAIFFPKVLNFGLSLPNTALIDFPIIYMMIFTFIVMLDVIRRPSESQSYVVLGLTLCCGYLLKHSFLTIFPVVLLFVLVESCRSPRTILKRLIIVFLPSILAYGLWQLYMSQMNAEQLLPVLPRMTGAELEAQISKRWEIVGMAWELLLDFPGRWQGFYTYIGMIGLFLGLIQPGSRKIFFYIWIFLLFNWACLVWIYLTGFADYEAYHLASFDRYAGAPFEVVKFFGLLLFLNFAFSKISEVSLRPYLAALLTGIISTAALARYQSGGHVAPRDAIQFERQSGYMLDMMKLRKWQVKPKVLIVAQGGISIEYNYARYNSPEPAGYAYEAFPYATFGEPGSAPPAFISTAKEMLARLQSVDIVWVIKTDAWMNSILKELTSKASDCEPPYEKYYFFQRDGRVECVAKPEDMYR